MPPFPTTRSRPSSQRSTGWSREADEIVKTYELPTFPDAITFVTPGRRARRAADHHPDIDIRYRKVRIALSTHDDGGITQKDFDLAGDIEAIGRSSMIFAVVIALVLLLCLAVVVAIAKDRGPGPEDVAVSYEMAWDRFDFDVLWTLSGRSCVTGSTATSSST